MYDTDLWKHCTPRHCREMILSFSLLEGGEWTDERIISCLYAVSNHTEQHYTCLKIPKKGGGVRRVMAPDPLLKTIQRNILHHILEGYEIPCCATAYHKGASIRGNAMVHLGHEVVLKLDIKDFFGSITFPMVGQRAFGRQYFPEPVGVLLTSLCCYNDRLPQGSPASAAVSNLVMRPFDRYMAAWCGQREVIYSRYCDDMTFSGDFDVSEVMNKANGFLGAMGFELNRSKTKVLTRQERQTVTGIVVNEKLQVPSSYRRELRRDVHYCLKYGVQEHLKRRNERTYLDMGKDGETRYLMSLSGKIRFVLSVNPQDRWFREADDRVKRLLRYM